MFKKIISFILVICLVFCLSTSVFARNNALVQFGATALASLGLLSGQTGLIKAATAINTVGTSISIVNSGVNWWNSYSDILTLSPVDVSSASFRVSDVNNSSQYLDIITHDDNVAYLVPSSLGSQVQQSLGSDNIALQSLKSSSEYIGFKFSPIEDSSTGYTIIGGLINKNTDSSLCTQLIGYKTGSSIPRPDILPNACYFNYANYFTTINNAVQQQYYTQYLESIEDYMTDINKALTNLPDSYHATGDWVKWSQGQLIISDLNSIVYQLQNLNVTTTYQNQLLQGIYTALLGIETYLPSIASDISIIKYNQINFFESVTLQLQTIQDSLDKDGAFSSANLFNLGSLSIGVIKGLLRYILVLLIAIFGFLGSVTVFLNGYLGFMPVAITSFLALVPIVAFGFGTIKFIRG